MSQKYDLESLITTFNEHAIQAEENRQRIISDFKANYPDQEVPANLLNDFNLPLALASMAETLNFLLNDYAERE